jgi:hypothetical protein
MADIEKTLRFEARFLGAAEACGDEVTVEYGKMCLAAADEIEALRARCEKAEAALVTQDELSNFIRDKADGHKGMLQPDFWPFLAMYLMEEFSIRRAKGSEADGR